MLVPRGTTAAEQVFGARLDLAERYAAALATSGMERGLIGPREVPRLWDRHLLNCAVIGELIPPGAQVIDVGSGAGLPGLALAIVRADISVCLLEPLLRRSSWLIDIVAELGLENVGVTRGRAGDQPELVGAFDIATARAVASMDVLGPWCLPYLRPGGRLLAIKGKSAAGELGAAGVALGRLGAADWRVVRAGEGVLELPTTVVVVTQGDPLTTKSQIASSGSVVDRPRRRPSQSVGARTRRRTPPPPGDSSV